MHVRCAAHNIPPLARLLKTGDASRTEADGFASLGGSFIKVDVKGWSGEDSSSWGAGFGEVRTGKRACLFVVIGDLMVEEMGGKMVPNLDSSSCR